MLNLIPDFSSQQQPCMLFLGAHSDDIEIGCGATVLTLAHHYPHAKVDWVVFNADGGRLSEARNSAKDFLSSFRESKIEVHQFRNAYFPSAFEEIKNAFEILKNRISPNLIFTHHKDDRHQDHRVIGEFTWNTFRDNVILEYEIPKFDGGLGDPNFFVDITAERLQQKLDKLSEHFGSQADKHWFSRDVFTALMRLRSVEGNCESGFAEAFYCRKAALDFRANNDRT